MHQTYRSEALPHCVTLLKSLDPATGNSLWVQAMHDKCTRSPVRFHLFLRFLEVEVSSNAFLRTRMTLCTLSDQRISTIRPHEKGTKFRDRQDGGAREKDKVEDAENNLLESRINVSMRARSFESAIILAGAWTWSLSMENNHLFETSATSAANLLRLVKRPIVFSAIQFCIVSCNLGYIFAWEQNSSYQRRGFIICFLMLNMFVQKHGLLSHACAGAICIFAYRYPAARQSINW